ncbi:hypothetical protein THSYN_05490 [Candidatus Thiodictyon syntrophicum]|jgi:NTE family protein|uniref:PNPLA domain-containing protein n=2 Tax=Candidatus Thiodictyon syntrophicum TaxID=1166950 RepID=A0A2K8U4E5_9GAMM|nr:hypothetical protein THSYN_05490 [Candidatus Thiodictyon syntrophicum]
MFTTDPLPYENPLKEDQITNLVFSGGGILGIAYVGAMMALDGLHVRQHIENYAGASAGAINALFGALDYTPDELNQEMQKMDFRKLLDTWLRFNLIKTISGRGRCHWLCDTIPWLLIPLSVWIFDGICRGRVVERWLEGVVSNKLKEKYGVGSECSFKQLKEKTGKGLFVLGCELNTRKFAVFSPDDTPDVRVVDAVVASMSIPFIFSPRCVAGKTYLDGGTTKDMPLDMDFLIRDDPKKPNPFRPNNTLGLMLNTKDAVANPRPKPLNGHWDWLGALFDAVLNQGTMQLFHDQRRIDQTVFIDPKGIEQLDFNLTPEQKQLLKQSAWEAVYGYFKKPAPGPCPAT